MKIFLSPLAEYKLTKLLAYIEEEWGTSSKNRFLENWNRKPLKFSVIPGAIPKQKILMTFIGVLLLPNAHFITGF